MSDEDRSLAPCLGEAFPGHSVRVVSTERIKPSVLRVRVEIDKAERSLVAKHSDALVTRRNWLVARRWLPAVGLEDQGPPLIAVVGEPSGEHAWHVYEDLGDCTLALDRDPAAVRSAVSLLSKMHIRFTHHPMLAEFRRWGAELGSSFYSANVRDAITCLEAIPPARLNGCGDVRDLRDRLLERMGVMRAEEDRRTEAITELGGPETLLHGDLWLSNAAVIRDGSGTHVRLIDWDKAGPGPIGYDLSTFVGKFPAGERDAVLGLYEEMVAGAGWRLPASTDLNYLFTTFELARLATCVVWSALELTRGTAIEWALEELQMADDALASLEPVLDSR
jgi:Phosphotransferase enzyme family